MVLLNSSGEVTCCMNCIHAGVGAVLLEASAAVSTSQVWDVLCMLHQLSCQKAHGPFTSARGIVRLPRILLDGSYFAKDGFCQCQYARPFPVFLSVTLSSREVMVLQLSVLYL